MDSSIIGRMQSFKEWFRGYEDNFVIIGGTACSLIMSEEEVDFRLTKDVDNEGAYLEKHEDFYRASRIRASWALKHKYWASRLTFRKPVTVAVTGFVAERMGFEPMVGCPTRHFQFCTSFVLWETLMECMIL